MAVLTSSLSLDDGRNLPSGARGAIVFVHAEGAAYEVEFSKPFHVVATVEAQHLRQAPTA